MTCPGTGGGCPPDCDRTQSGCVNVWGSDTEYAEAAERNAHEPCRPGCVNAGWAHIHAGADDAEWNKAAARNADRGTGAINDGEPQQVTLSGREYERYLDGGLNEPQNTAYCGALRDHPDLPYACTEPRGHDDAHGHKGVYWLDSKSWISDTAWQDLHNATGECTHPEPALTPDELIGLRGLLQERYNPELRVTGRPNYFAGAAASLADGLPGQRLASVTPSVREDKQQVRRLDSPPVDPQLVVSSAGDSAGEVSDNPQSPSPASPAWVDWATPAICTVLHDHMCQWSGDTAKYECYGASDRGVPHGQFGDEQGWLEHVSALIAARLERAANPPTHTCVHCEEEIFTNDGGETWWHGQSGLPECYRGTATTARPQK